MALGNFYLTNAGNALLAKAQSGTSLNITRAQIGEGTWPEGTTYANITNLVKPIKYLSIISKTDSSGQAKITVQFSNRSVGRAFRWTEFGLWAADPDYPEDRSHDILYGTSYAGDMPVPIDSALTEFIFNVLIKTGQATNVTVTIDSSLIYLTKESLDEMKGMPNGLATLDESGKVVKTQLPDMNYDPAGSASKVQQALDSHVKNKENPHGVTAVQIKAIPESQKGKPNGVASLDETGKVEKAQIPEIGGKRTSRITIGTSVSGWSSNDCDYLCDGIDDDIKINAAIQALPSTGGEIVILDGTYNIKSTIAINKDNVKLSGNGASTVLKRMFNGSSKEGVVTISAPNGCCRVDNLKIDGNKESYTYFLNYGIYLFSSNNTVTRNICITCAAGISISNSGNNTISGNICNNCNYGIYLSGSSDNVIAENTCIENHYGIYHDSSSSNIITVNTCNNNEAFGIYLSGNSVNNAITGNTCNNNGGNGIYLSECSNNAITGNTCSENKYGISLSGCRNNSITGNACSSTSANIMTSNSDNNAITGNTCNNGSRGIEVSNCTKSTVSGNTCIDNTLSGIYMSKSSNNAITGNTCIRGNGQTSDYTGSQYTIFLIGTANNNNLIADNNIMGKNYITEGGDNTFINNKYN